MIVTAEVDPSEGGRYPDRPEVAKVLVFAEDVRDQSVSLDNALSAIRQVRLIREGHVYTTEIHHALSAMLSGPRFYPWGVYSNGEVFRR